MDTWIYNDGGRAGAGFKGEAQDCVTRAIAIATGLPYSEVYAALAEGNASQRASSRTSKRPKSAGKRICTKRKWFKDYMAGLGFIWRPCMGIGTGCTTHFSYFGPGTYFGTGTYILALSKHYTVIKDGVIHDTHDPSRNNTRCIYGFWFRPHN
jgi:hypothetical protein